MKFIRINAAIIKTALTTMAFEVNDLKGFLFLVLFTIPSTVATNIDCNGKSFHCLSSTQFMICVDLGGGITSTIDDFVISCPPTTECHKSNQYECEFPKVQLSTTSLPVTSVSNVNVLPPLMNSVTTILPVDITTEVPSKNTQTEAILIPLETSTSKNTHVSDTLKKEVTGEKATEFIYNITFNNTVSANVDNITATSFNTKEYSIESTTKTPTIFTKKLATDSDIMTASPMIIDSFTESNFNINTVTENFYNKFSIQTNVYRNEDLTQTATSHLNSVNTTASDTHPLRTMVNQIMSVTASPNNVVVTDNMTDTKMSEKDSPKMVETLQKLKEEFLDDKEMVFESNNSAPITVVTYNTENTPTHFHTKDSMLTNDQKYSIESTTKTISTVFPKEVLTNQDEKKNSTTLLDSFTESIFNVNTAKENFKNQSTTQVNDYGNEGFLTQTAVPYENSVNITELDITNSTTVNQTIPVTTSSNNIIVTDIIADVTVLEKSIPNRVVTLQKLKEEFSGNKQMIVESNNTTPINTVSQSADSIVATNLKTEDITLATDKKYNIESTTKIFTTVFARVPTNHNKIMNSTILVETTELNSNGNTMKENFENQFTTQIHELRKEIFPTQTATSYVNSVNKTKLDRPYSTIVNQIIPVTASASNFVVTEIKDAEVSQDTSKRVKKLQTLKEEFSDIKGMVFESNNTTPITRVSYNADNTIPTNFHAKNSIGTTDKKYDNESPTKTSTTVFTMEVPINHDKIRNSTILADILTESNSNINTVKDVFNNQFTTQLTEFRKEGLPTQNTTSYANSNNKADLDRLDSTIGNEMKSFTAVPNNFVVTDIITNTKEFEKNTSKRVETLQNLKDEFSYNKETIFESNNTAPINTVSFITSLAATNLKAEDSTPTTDKKYNFEFTTETSTLLTMEVTTDHDRIMESTTLDNTFTEQNASLNIMKENVHSQFTTQINEIRKEVFPTQTSNFDSDKIVLDRPDIVMVKQTKPITEFLNNFMVTDIIVDATVSEKNIPKSVEELQKLKNNKEMVFEYNNTIPINRVSYNTNNIIPSNSKVEDSNFVTDKKYNIESTTETSNKLFTIEEPTNHNKIRDSTILSDTLTESNSNINTVREDFHNQFTTQINEFRKGVFPTQTATSYVTPINTVDLDRSYGTMLNRIMSVTASPNNIAVTDIKDTEVTPKTVERLQKLKAEFSDNKDMAFESNNTTPINEVSYNGENGFATNAENTTLAIDNKYSIESITKTSATFVTTEVPTNHEIIRVDTFTEPNSNINKVRTNFNDQFTTQINEFTKEFPTQIATSNGNLDKTRELDRPLGEMNNEIKPLTENSYNSVVTDIMRGTKVSGKNPTETVEVLQKLKKDFSNNNDMIYESNNTTRNNTVSYNADNIITTNFNANDVTPANNKTYSIESTTKSYAIPLIFTANLPDIITDKTVSEKHISKKIETFQNLKEKITDYKEISFKTSSINTPINARVTTENVLATNYNMDKFNLNNHKLYSSESTIGTSAVLYRTETTTDPTILDHGYFASNNDNRDKSKPSNQYIQSTGDSVKSIFPVDTIVLYLNADGTDKHLKHFDNSRNNHRRKSAINHISIDSFQKIEYITEKNETNTKHSTTENPIRNMTLSESNTLEVAESTPLLDSTVIEGLVTTSLVLGESIKPVINVSCVTEFSILNLAEATENTLLAKITTEKATTLEPMKAATTVTPLGHLSTQNFMEVTPKSTFDRVIGLNITKDFYYGDNSPPEYSSLQNENSNSLSNLKIDRNNLTKASISPLKLSHLITTETSKTSIEASARINDIISRQVTPLPRVSTPKNIETKTIYNSSTSRTSSSKKAPIKQKPEVRKELLYTKSAVGESDIGDFETSTTVQFDSLVIIDNSEIVMGNTTSNTLIRPVTEPTYMVEMIDTKGIKTKEEPIIPDMIFKDKHIRLTTQNSSQNKIPMKTQNPTLYSKIPGNFSNQGDVINVKTSANIIVKPEINAGTRDSKTKNEDQSREQNHFYKTYYEIPSLVEVISPDNLVNNHNKRDTGYNSNLENDAHVVHMTRNMATSGNSYSRTGVNSTTYDLDKISDTHKGINVNVQGNSKTKEEISQAHNNLIKQSNLTFNNISQHHTIVTTNSAVRHISYKQTNQINNKLNSSVPSIKDTNNTIIDNSKLAFDCQNHTRGKYADNKDCRKFYICIGNLQQIVGTCPNNTVFSEINKQCTRNLSHCVRNNQFHCLYEGRFIDFFNDNIYFICVKNKLHFIRYKLQCQSGYHINKVSVKCEKDVETFQSASLSENSKITNERTESPRKSDESEILEIKNDFQCRKEGKFPYINDCRKYYVCYKNKKGEYRRKIKKCSKDEVYDKDKKKCKVADSMEC